MPNIFGFFKSAGKAGEESLAKTATRTAGRSEPIPKAVAKTKIKDTPGMAVKPSEVATTPKVWRTQGTTSTFKEQAKNVVGSKSVKVAGSIGASAVVIGGGTYALGSLGGKGLGNLGYGIRGLTSNYTPEDVAKQQLQTRKDNLQVDQKEFDLLKNYTDWAKQNGLSDSPSTRDAFNRYVLGQTPGENKQVTNNSSVLPYVLIAGGLVAAGLLLKKKKGGKK